MEIKNTISFDEFNAVVTKVTNDCFIDNAYSPAYFDISLRTALISAFAPDFELNDDDNNALYESVYTDNACIILDEIKEKPQYQSIVEAVNNAILYRTNIAISGKKSEIETAIANLINKITEIANKMDGNFDAESTKKFIDSINSVQNGITEKGMVKAIFDSGLLDKPRSGAKHGKH